MEKEITKRQLIIISYFIIRASLFGFGYSRIISLAKTDAITSVIIGTLLGLLVVIMINKITNIKRDYLITKIILVILNSYFIVNTLSTLINFSSSFYLLKTPNYIVALSVMFFCLYVVKKDIVSIVRISEILFYGCIIINIGSIFLLFNKINPANFDMILKAKPYSIIKSSFIYMIFTTIPLINLFSIKNQHYNLIKIYLFTSICILLLMITIIGVFGPNLTLLLRYPEYIILKRIKLLSFIEKVENILSITYLYESLIFITINLYNIKKTLNNNKIYNILVILIYLITVKVIMNNYTNALSNYYISPIIYTIGLLLIIIFFFKAIKKKPKLQIQRDI